MSREKKFWPFLPIIWVGPTIQTALEVGLYFMRHCMGPKPIEAIEASCMVAQLRCARWCEHGAAGHGRWTRRKCMRLTMHANININMWE